MPPTCLAFEWNCTVPGDIYLRCCYRQETYIALAILRVVLPLLFLVYARYEYLNRKKREIPAQLYYNFYPSVMNNQQAATAMGGYYNRNGMGIQMTNMQTPVVAQVVVAQPVTTRPGVPTAEGRANLKARLMNFYSYHDKMKGEADVDRLIDWVISEGSIPGLNEKLREKYGKDLNSHEDLPI